MNTSTPINHALAKAVQQLGGYAKTADLCEVNISVVWRWAKRGRLPRTEWTGETHYAELIEAATQGAITKAELLSYIPPKPDLSDLWWPLIALIRNESGLFYSRRLNDG
ncbi:MAG: helix-turn-helix domain-containing protein [Synechococcaceae cyanobacterium SM1_2_3]|nr:helix-turn-helix domain-containing protein [Synechococcaceae cyanobacterium SM1_2_3]